MKIYNYLEYLKEQKHIEEDVINILKNNNILGEYLTGKFIGNDNTTLLNSLESLIELKNKYPNILKPQSNIFYRADVIKKTSQLEHDIIDNSILYNDLSYIKQLSKLTPNLLENVIYQPMNKLQGWTSDLDFAAEHWYNVYIMNQGNKYNFDTENYFSCIYIIKDNSDFIFNDDFLDKLRIHFGGNGAEKESLRIGNSVNCDVIIMNDL